MERFVERFLLVIEKIDQLKRTLDLIDVTKRSEFLIFQWLRRKF